MSDDTVCVCVCVSVRERGGGRAASGLAELMNECAPSEERFNSLRTVSIVMKSVDIEGSETSAETVSLCLCVFRERKRQNLLNLGKLRLNKCIINE